MGNSPGAGNEPSRVLFRHATVLDTASGELAPDQTVLVEGDRIREVGGTDAGPREARVADLRGMTLMPGLIDAHVHVTAVTADLSAMAEWSPSYVTSRASLVLRGMLQRGFTTVRDVGGADYGLAAAIDEGFIDGPRLIFGGKALSQTGGHGNLMDESSISLFKEKKAFYVPTLATYSALAADGLAEGMPRDSYRKLSRIVEAGTRALELAHRSGIPIAYGTDLLGGMHRAQ